MTIDKRKVTWRISNYGEATPKFITAVVMTIKGALTGSAITAIVNESPYWALGFTLGMGLLDEFCKCFAYEN